jgi:hypothetical protein
VNPLTNSEMALFTSCRRGWWLRYYRGLRRVGDLPSLPDIGNMYHAGLERYYRGELTNAAPYVRELADKLLSDPEYGDFADQIATDAEMACIMLDGYFEWLAETGADSGYEVIGAEMPMEVPLGDTGFRLRGKIDTRLLRVMDDAKVQLENKTVGNLSDIPKYAQSAPQFLTYDLLAYLDEELNHTGVRTDGIIINMAKRVKRTVRAKPPFYSRCEVYHNLDELRAHYRHVVAIGRGIKRTRNALDKGANHHDVCPPSVNRNHTWSCPCSSITVMFDDGSDVEGYLSSFYVEHDPWARYEKKEVG